MVELSNERIDRILHEETVKKEDQETILRGIYTRYMRLYEKYMENVDGLDDAEIAKLREYHEETISLVKNYYMDIPQDICMWLREFDNTYSVKLLGHEWHEFLFSKYEEFKEKSKDKSKGEDYLKAEFKRQTLMAFYDTMDYIFREGFGTGSTTTKKVVSGIAELLFGKKQ